MFSPTSNNVTVMFPTGAGVEVRLREGTMTTTVLLPEEFINSTLGLLGMMNHDDKDDLVSSDGQPVQDLSNPEELFKFGASCKKKAALTSYIIFLTNLLKMSKKFRTHTTVMMNMD